MFIGEKRKTLKMNCFCTVIFAISIVNFFIIATSADVPKSKEVKCAVCRSIVYEIHKTIKEVDPRKTVETGSFRLDANGGQNRTPKKYAGSETHMTELLDSLCETFSDYVQARHKETNVFEAIKIIENGQMNPRFGEYELIKDPDLNKGVKYHCQSIIEDYEDQILDYFPKNTDLDIELSKDIFCEKETDICVGVRDEL